MSFFKNLNRGGKIVFVCITMAVILIVPMSLCGYIMHCIQNNDVETFVPLTFKECPSVEKGIIFMEDGIEVRKDIFFCNAIVEKEIIPQKTILHFPHGDLKISPIKEDGVKAIYAISHNELYSREWHVVPIE
jgi:hypothetical protein